MVDEVVPPIDDSSVVTIGRRISGYFVDAALGLLAGLLIFVAWGLALAQVDFLTYDTGRGLVVLITWGLGVAMTLAFGLMQWGWLARRGATLGQRWAGYRLTDASTGAAPGWGRAFLYFLMMGLLGSLTLGIGLIVMAVVAGSDSQRRTWIDRASNLQSSLNGKVRAHAAVAIVATLASWGLATAAVAIPILVVEPREYDYYVEDDGFVSSPDEYDVGSPTAVVSMNECWDGNVVERGIRCELPRGEEAVYVAFGLDASQCLLDEGNSWNSVSMRCEARGEILHFAVYSSSAAREERLIEYTACTPIEGGRQVCSPNSDGRTAVAYQAPELLAYVSCHPGAIDALEAVRDLDQLTEEELFYGTPIDG